jgi:L-ribulokinase
MAGRFVVGVDFGTTSTRALLVDVETGQEMASASMDYPGGVIDEVLPAGGVALPPTWALQDPDDYLITMQATVRDVVADSRVTPADVIGLGIDATSCTTLPTSVEGVPLSRLARYRADPHAWAKLWKHHAAQSQADRITDLAATTQQDLLARYGGRVSAEWLLPKALQILDEAPDIFSAAQRLIEAADWIVWQLTGRETRAAQLAGFKAMFRAETAGEGVTGYPPVTFLAALDRRFP